MKNMIRMLLLALPVAPFSSPPTGDKCVQDYLITRGGAIESRAGADFYLYLRRCKEGRQELAELEEHNRLERERLEQEREQELKRWH